MTPRYYAIRINAHEPHDSPESARKEAESLPLGEGDEWGILELVGVTRRSVTTTWLDKPDAAADLMRASTGWSWPILPSGHSYLNPGNLTVEQLGDGWRPLCTLDVDVPGDSQIYLQCAWDHSGLLGKTWLQNRYVTSVHWTYRTRAPIPTLPGNP